MTSKTLVFVALTLGPVTAIAGSVDDPPAPNDRLLAGIELSYGTGVRAGWERWNGRTATGVNVHFATIERTEGALDEGDDSVTGTAMSAMAFAGLYADRRHWFGIEVGAGPGFVTGTYTDADSNTSRSASRAAIFFELSARLGPAVAGISVGAPDYEFAGAPDGLALVGTSGRIWVGLRFKLGPRPART